MWQGAGSAASHKTLIAWKIPIVAAPCGACMSPRAILLSDACRAQMSRMRSCWSTSQSRPPCPKPWTSMMVSHPSHALAVSSMCFTHISHSETAHHWSHTVLPLPQSPSLAGTTVGSDATSALSTVHRNRYFASWQAARAAQSRRRSGWRSSWAMSASKTRG